MPASRTKSRAAQIPGYVAGTWAIDPVHSEVSFTVRHLMVAKVRGVFSDVSGTLELAEDPSDSAVTATIAAASIDSRNENRDEDLRSERFLDVEKYPTIEYRSTGLRAHRDGTFTIDGELLLHGVARPVALDAELNGFVADPYGGTRVGFSATARVNRRDFGITIDMPLDGGGVVVSDWAEIGLEIEAVLTEPASA